MSNAYKNSDKNSDTDLKVVFVQNINYHYMCNLVHNYFTLYQVILRFKDRKEENKNIVVKGENVGNFLMFPGCFLSFEGWSIVKLAQFVYIINALIPIDFEKRSLQSITKNADCMFYYEGNQLSK